MPRPGPEDPGQYSFGDRARVERILKEAGFGAPTVEPIDRQIWMGKHRRRGARAPAASVRWRAPSPTPSPRPIDKAKKAIAEALEPHQGPDGVRLPGACWLVSAAPR